MGFSVFAQENCQFSVIINSDKLKETGVFQLVIKNTGDKSFKVPKKINLCNIRLENLELLNKENGNYEKMKMANKDIDCFKYEKRKIIKPNKIYKYIVDIKSDFDVMQANNFFDTFNDKTYRFKISFYLDFDNQCGDSNNLITDWIYKY